MKQTILKPLKCIHPTFMLDVGTFTETQCGRIFFVKVNLKPAMTTKKCDVHVPKQGLGLGGVQKVNFELFESLLPLVDTAVTKKVHNIT